MALTFIGNESVPTYLALSTDIVGSTISGIGIVGGFVLTYDDGKWYIIEPDLTLSPYSISNSLSPSENVIGKVGGSANLVTVTPVLTVAATYVTGDYVGTSAAPMTFNSCARVAGGTGLVTSCMLIDYGSQSVAGELWLFDGSVVPPADSAAWTLSDADMQKCIGIIPFATFYASALNTVSYGIPALAIGFKCGSALRELYGCFVTRGSPTYATGNLTFKLNVLQD
jgi:hypothetical protein